MLTRGETKRNRDASAPVHLDTTDVRHDEGHDMSCSKIRTPNGRKPKSNFGWQKYEREGRELLPGIPNEITLDLITPKLPWITFHTMQSVSSSWRQAIQSRQVYNARCRAHATEAVITIDPLCERGKHGRDDVGWIGLYSMREEKIYHLPGIGNSPGVPTESQCISLDGKVYVMGGLSSHRRATRSMYMLDLVAGKGWKRCASMKNERSQFGCCIVDGKIFVCGGHVGERDRHDTSRDKSLLEPEIYDPELDLWSSLKSMTFLRFGNQAAVLGDEILVYGGFHYVQGQTGPFDTGRRIFPEIYNPNLDEWRTVEDPGLSNKKCLFVTQGKIHSIEKNWHKSKLQVQVYNLEKKSWSTISSFSVEVDGRPGTDEACPLVVDNEIVRLVGFSRGPPTYRLIHSSGFSLQREISAWQTARTPFYVPDTSIWSAMSIIRL